MVMNRRILHGREAFSGGRRNFVGFYAARMNTTPRQDIFSDACLQQLQMPLRKYTTYVRTYARTYVHYVQLYVRM